MNNNKQGNHALPIFYGNYGIECPLAIPAARIVFLAQFSTGSDAWGTVYMQDSDKYTNTEVSSAENPELSKVLSFNIKYLVCPVYGNCTTACLYRY